MTETYEGFSQDERDAMKQRAKELKTAARRGSKATPEEIEQDVLATIAAMEGEDRRMAERIHAIVRDVAPDLAPKLWYGFPSYARKGKIVCFFQPATKFKTRYATLAFNDAAALDDGSMWPTAFALTQLTEADEKRVAELVRRAAQ